MPAQPAAAPDSTAVRTALWRAMHVEVGPPPVDSGLPRLDPIDALRSE